MRLPWIYYIVSRTTGVVQASLSCCAAVVQVLCALFVCFLKADTLIR